MLTNLADFSEGLTLVPDSGIQFVEFGFDFDQSPRLSRSFVERKSPGQVDADGKTLVRLLTNWMDDDPTAPFPYSSHADDVANYEVNKSLALNTFLNRWVPMPFFKLEPGRDDYGNEIYAQGPTDWVRARVTETRKAYQDEEATHRIIFAFDTSLAPKKPNRPYLAPSPEDASRTESFRYMSRLADIISFLSHKINVPDRGDVDIQQWVDDWLRDIFYSYKKAEKRGRELRADDFPYKFEHLARYITFVQLIASVIKLGRVTLIDTVSETKAVQPIDVDLVLDIGNSRSCGLLIQSFPDDMNVDLNNSLVMELRDLSKPELVYREPFESQCELVAAEFGTEDKARRSGRSRAFFWPSLLRIGPEASRLRGESEGTEAATGMSSPKRYLWSSDPVLQPWKFRSATPDEDGTVQPLVERTIYRFVNDRGDVLEQLESDRQKYKLKVMEQELQTASRFSFSKSSFFTFMLSEIIAQAMSMMNNPGVRRQRRLKDVPRRLRRIIMTIPSATPVQEQRILKSRAEAAVKLVWSLAGWSDTQNGINSKRPEVHCSWDEASSVHLVYLYGEAVQKLGSIRSLFDILGKDRERPASLPPNKAKAKQEERSLRIASVDVGGGTTDLMVTTYYQTDNVALYPDQNFREGFRIAGDDLLKTIIESLIIPRFEEQLAAAGLGSARNFLKDRFAGDNPTMSEQEKHLRRQFVLEVLQPIAIGILSECEAMSPNERHTTIRKASEFFDMRDDDEEAEIPVDERILEYLKGKAYALGAEEFRIADCDILIDPVAVEECVLATFDSVFDNIGEAINHLDADVVLLTGRPMRLPQMVSLFTNKMAVRTDAVIPIRDYRVGTWYPFRGVSNTHIDDPKTTAVVGAMLCALSESSITNFTLYSQYLRMRSTARYIGRLESGTTLTDEKLLFRDIDLDSIGEAEETTFDYHNPVRIGFRQLPLERWVATPLYKLTVAQSRTTRHIPKPIKVTIARNAQNADEEETNEAILLSSELTREEFVIEDAEDASGAPVNRLMELKLDTLAIDTGDGYWLDTGILSIQ